MSDLTITASGNATRDAELRYTQSGKAVCNVTIACNKRVKNADGEWEDGPATFIDVTVWDQLAENVAATVTKGLRIVATGDLMLDQYEREDGTKGQRLKLTATDLAVSLRWATGHMERTNKAHQGAPARTASRHHVEEDPF